MKIIKRSPWIKECKCKTCGTEVGIQAHDVRYWTKHDYGGGFECGTDWICPVCMEDNNVKVPSAIEEMAEAAWRANDETMISPKRMVSIGKENAESS